MAEQVAVDSLAVAVEQAVGAGPTSTTIGGNGGAGYTSSISGSSLSYAGGGGGAGHSGSAGGSGGSGVGGTGGSNSASATVPTANRGGGGGGSISTSFPSTSGADGVVIIRYLGAQNATGGTITNSGGYTIHTFTSSGTFTPY